MAVLSKYINVFQ